MALIKCEDCGIKIDNGIKVCPNCGCPITNDEESKLLVFGYTQFYLVNPKVKVYINDKEVGSVGKGQLLEIEIKEDCEVEFKCSVRKAKIFVKAGYTTRIKITWDRITGQLVPKIIDKYTDNDSF